MNINFEELKKKVDIVRVVGTYLELKKTGSGYSAICPFHNDTSPSLMISPSKQIFNCFVCHTGGDAFHFIQKYEKISYLEAVKKACDICGVDCDIKLNDHSVNSSDNKNLYLAIDDLTKYYQYYLKTEKGLAALNYLHQRGLGDEIIQRFKIGFAPADPSLSVKLLREKKGHKIDDLTKAGIITESSTTFNDRFSDRIIFPLSDRYGRVVGFSGRTMKSDKSIAKYMNSPETPIFVKNEVLYNFFEAREEAKKLGYIYVVEGFMDAIALAKANLPAVALMGTALTQNHSSLLASLNVEIRLSLDSDKAGKMASLASAKVLKKAHLRFQIVKPLEGNKDPDELLKLSGPNGLIQAMNMLEEPLIYIVQFLKEENELANLAKVEEFLKEYKDFFVGLSQVEKDVMIPKVADLIGLDIETLRMQFRNHQPDAPTRERKSLSPHQGLVKDLQDVINRLEGMNAKNRELVIDEIRILNYLRSSKEAENYFTASKKLLSLKSLELIRQYFNEYYNLYHRDKDCIDKEGLLEIKEKMQEQDSTKGAIPIIDVLIEHHKPNDLEIYEKREFQARLNRHENLLSKLNNDEILNRTTSEEEEAEALREIIENAKKKVRKEI